MKTISLNLGFKQLKIDSYNQIIIIVSLSLFIISITLGVTINTYNVIGTNQTNDTVTTRANVTNTEPTLYSVQLTPASIDLNPGGTYTVTCNGSVYDINGWDDIGSVKATFYETSNGDGTPGDNNYRYINGSCLNSSGDPNCVENGANENGSCICTFSVWYYAFNGTWQCNMTVGDSGNLNSTALSNTVDVNTVLGIDVPTEIDFGDLSVSETSGDITANITNWGNVDINTSVWGYGGDTHNNNLSMICATGNISNTYLRYSKDSNALFGDMINITNISTPISDIKMTARTNDSFEVLGEDRNQTFWKLQIPPGVAGVCNGTLEFDATDAS